MARSRGMVIGFWIVTALFCLQIGFTAYAQLRLPQVAEMFTFLGFPAYFRVELSWAKLAGVVLLLLSALVLAVVRSKPFQMNMKQDVAAPTSATTANTDSRKGAL